MVASNNSRWPLVAFLVTVGVAGMIAVVYVR